MNYQITFWMLVGAAVILVVGIAIMAGSIQAILKSKSFIDRKSNTDVDKIVKAILLIIGFSFISSSTWAATEEPNPIFQPEFSDLLGVAILDMILLFIFIYFKKIFDNLAAQILPAHLIKKKNPWFKLNKALTDAVEIEHEEDIMMDHEYDGIRELDNNLPPWWKYGFYTSIVFAVLYLGNYHILKTGALQIEEYETSMELAEIQKQEYLKTLKSSVDENNVTLLSASDELSAGQSIFKNNCAICHGENAQGNTGPNLTDENWIYGNEIKNVFTTIKYGTANGMKAWGEDDELLGHEIQQVASYVISLHGTFASGGLPPQGDKYDKPTPAEE